MTIEVYTKEGLTIDLIDLLVSQKTYLIKTLQILIDSE